MPDEREPFVVPSTKPANHAYLKSGSGPGQNASVCERQAHDGAWVNHEVQRQERIT